MKKDKKYNTETMGGRLKGYEADYESEIEPEKNIVVRIDGHKFSKFTKGFEKPFDEILSKAMELTTIDLLEEFNASTSYTQSDEITLIIPTLINTEKHKGTNKPLWKHGYSGRVQKMVSLIAGFTTMSFNKHLNKLVSEKISKIEEAEYYEIVMDKEYNYLLDIKNHKVGNAWFDARIYGVDSDEEAFNSVLWRIRDAEKNSRSMFAQSYCSHKELQGKTGQEQVQYCLEKTGKDWEKVEDRYKYGILVKKEKYLKPVDTGTMDYAQQDFVERSRIIVWAEHLTYSDKNVQMIINKYKG